MSTIWTYTTALPAGPFRCDGMIDNGATDADGRGVAEPCPAMAVVSLWANWHARTHRPLGKYCADCAETA